MAKIARVSTTISLKAKQGGTNIPRLAENVALMSARNSYDCARGIQRVARVLAPKRTGNLARSIKRVKISVGVHQVIVGAFYGIYVEYGTRNMAAQPFFHTAIAAEKARYYANMRKVFRK